MRNKKILALILLCLSAATAAQELKPFTAGSMADIEARYDGRPFILALWSLTCPPCLHELETLSAWHTANPNLSVVLISTDGQRQATGAQQKLAEVGLNQADTWIYADSYVEKLRFTIDPGWRGELPRSYLYLPNGQRQGFSGVLTTQALEKWRTLIQKTDKQK